MKHGATAYRDRGCRCDTCREAHAEKQRGGTERRRASRVLVDGRLVAPLPAEKHGRWSTYVNYSCRCDPCVQAGSAVNARNNAARRAAREPVRLGELLPDLVDRLTETTAQHRANQRHEGDK